MTREELVNEPKYRPGLYEDFVTPCEVCADRRKNERREELQAWSMMTDAETRIRLADIRTGTGENIRRDTARMVESCAALLAGRGSFLTISGTSGNAKSMALIAMVNEFLDRGIAAVYLPMYDLLNHIQAAFDSTGETKSESAVERLERLKAIQVLAIDEAGAARMTDWRAEQVRNLIDFRWRRGLDRGAVTLLAMNEDPAMTFEPRIYSRLKDGRNMDDGMPPIIFNNDSDLRSLLKRK